jgi:hypothetical protein
MDGGLPVSSFLLFLAALATFLLPGYGWVTWLHARDRLGWPLRLVLGFAWSFALFSLLGGPFLWFRGQFSTFLAVLGLAWAVFGLAAAAAYARSRQTFGRAQPAGPPREGGPSDLPPRPPLGGWLPFVLSLGLAAGSALLWMKVGARKQALLIAYSPALLLFGGWLAWRVRGPLAALLSFGAEDEAPPPRLWTAAAAAAVLLQAVSAVAYYRPDWDDCFYLAAVLDYKDAAALNQENPADRGLGFPMAPTHRALCWELWGAVLCRLSGSSPLVLYHSLLPGLLVLGAYAAYAGLLGDLLPRRWVPLALLVLSGYHVWGLSSQASAPNHFLVRVWQGKSVLLHLALPLTALALLRYARRPDWRWGATFCACLWCGVGASTSGVFLGGALVGCLSAALLPAVNGGRPRFLAGAALALAPLALEALAVLAALPTNTGLRVAPAAGRSSWQAWLGEVQDQAGRGVPEVLWVVSLPLLAVLARGRVRRAYLVVYPALLLVTFANPFLAGRVMANVTSSSAYYRIFWLFPVGTGLAALLALSARLAGRLAEGLARRRFPHLPLALCGLALAASPLLPGAFVWAPANNLGPFMTPRLADNLEKAPAEVVLIADLLAHDPGVREGTILCGEEVASFLTPHSRSFRLVVSRPMYTVGGLGHAGEALERFSLVVLSQRGKAVPDLSWGDWDFLAAVLGGRVASELQADPARPTVRDFPRLLKRYRVSFVVTSPVFWAEGPLRQVVLRGREELLEESGFYAAYRGREYTLWKRRPQGRAPQSRGTERAPPPAATSRPSRLARSPSNSRSRSRTRCSRRASSCTRRVFLQ